MAGSFGIGLGFRVSYRVKFRVFFNYFIVFNNSKYARILVHGYTPSANRRLKGFEDLLYRYYQIRFLCNHANLAATCVL